MMVFKKKDDQGFIAPVVLGIAMIILVIGVIFIQLGHAVVDRGQLVSVADAASNAGATAINEQALIDNPDAAVELDVAGAEARCEAYIVKESKESKTDIDTTSSHCEATPTQVIAYIKGSVSLGAIFDKALPDGKLTFDLSAKAKPSCSDQDTTDPDYVQGGCGPA